MLKFLLVSPILATIPIQGSQMVKIGADERCESDYTTFSEVYRTIYNDTDLSGSGIVQDYNIGSINVNSNASISNSQMHTEKYASHETNDARYNPPSIEMDFQTQLYTLMSSQVQRGNEADAQHPGQYYTIYKLGFLPQFEMTWKEWHYQYSSHEVYQDSYIWFSRNLDNETLSKFNKATGSPEDDFSSASAIESGMGYNLTAQSTVDQHYNEDTWNPYHHDWNNGVDAPNAVRMGFVEKLHSEFNHTYNEEDLYPSANNFTLAIHVLVVELMILEIHQHKMLVI